MCINQSLMLALYLDINHPCNVFNQLTGTRYQQAVRNYY